MNKQELGLYSATVLIWGSTWYFITWQLGVVPLEQSLAYRFFTAACMLLLFFLWQNGWQRIARLSLFDHMAIFLQGSMLFSTNYFAFYWITQYLTSGLVAVIFATLIIFNTINQMVFFRSKFSPQQGIAIVLGLSGIYFLFYRELHEADTSHETLIA
ncbi:MAG: DMT family transporter, partial [Pseudomonadota bacterium]